MSDRPDDRPDHEDSLDASSPSDGADDPAAWFDSGDDVARLETAETETPSGWIGENDEVDFVDAPSEDEIRASSSGWRRWAPAGFVGIGVVAVVAIGLSLIGGGDEADPDPEALVPRSEQSSDTAGSSASDDCTAGDDAVTVSNGEGDASSVAGAVVAFNYGYYTERSAEAALEVADSDRFDADALQAGIDTVPEGTTHCVRVAVDGATAAVELTESRPGGDSEVYEQVVETSEDDGQVSITQIRETESEGDDSDDEER